MWFNWSGNGGLVKSKVVQNELIVNRGINEDNNEILQVKIKVWQEQWLMQLKFNQKFCLTWNRTTSMWVFYKFNYDLTFVSFFIFQ